MSRFEEEVLRLLRDENKRLVRIEKLLSPEFSARITLKGSHMDIGNIAAGSTGTFAATLLANGTPYVPPAGSTFVPQWTWSCSDTTVTISPSADTTSAVFSVPANDTGTSLTAGVSIVAPDGSTQTASLTVTLTPGQTSVTFTASLAQTA